MSARHRRTGFTLIELMVALTIAAIVISTILTVAASSAHHFHEQQRIGALQLSVRMAAERIRRDIERAGLQGTADSAAENLCVAPSRRIVAVEIDDNDAGGRAAINTYQAAASNSVQTDRLRIAGNFDTSDAYLVRGLDATGSQIYLQTAWQGFRRSFSDVLTDPTGNTYDSALFQQVFPRGRMIHVVNTAGCHFFSVVQGASVVGNDAIVSVLPAIPVGGTTGGLLEGGLLAPISQVEYAIVATPPDMPAPRTVAVTGPDTALVRRVYDMGSATTLLRETTILEWAVHFDVDAVVDTAGVGLPPAPTVVLDGAAEAALPMGGGVNSRRARSLLVTVAARTDQDARFPWAAPVAGGPLSRFRVFSDRSGAARVRQARVDVALLNLSYRGL